MLTFHSKQRFGTRSTFELPERLKLKNTLRPRSLIDYRVDPRGMFASAKMGCMVPWGERAERDFMLLLEADPQIVKFERRPIEASIQIPVDGKVRIYTPNLRVIRRDSTTLLVAICAQDQLLHPLHSDLRAAAKKAYQIRGMNFDVVDTQSIYQEPRFSNSLAISTARNIPVGDEWIAWMAEFIPAGGSRTLSEIETAFGGRGTVRNRVLALISRGVLLIDLGAAITPQSRIALGHITVDGSAHG